MTSAVRARLALVEDDRRFKYPNYFQAPEADAAFCWLRLFHDAQTDVYVAVVTELPENHGLSVTNGAERIATLVCRQFGIHPDRYVHVEHYLAGRSWDPDAWGRKHLPETFTRQRLLPPENELNPVRGLDGRFTFRLMFRGVEPEYMTRAQVEALLGQPLEDCR